MATVVASLTNYPTLQDVANLVRTLLNDDGKGLTGTVGEGQIVIDNASVSVKLINALNSALSETYEEMGNVGDPTLISDNYIVKNLPPVQGVNGIGAPDPAAQVQLGYAGFYDGTQWWPQFFLPPTMFEPTRVWQRLSNSNLPFAELPQAQDGLCSAYQGNLLGEWEWRGDGIWMNGALLNCDIRIRSRIKLPLFRGTSLNYNTTYIPLQGCVNAVAYKTAAKVDFSLGNSESSAELKKDADRYMFLLKNARVRRKQGVIYTRPAYQDEMGVGLGAGFEW